MELDDETLAALGYGHALAWWERESGVQLGHARTLAAPHREHTAEELRAIWRERKRRQRADREKAAEQYRRDRRRKGHMSMQAWRELLRRQAEHRVSAGGRQLALPWSDVHRAETNRAHARWRAKMVSTSATAAIERVIAGLDIDVGHW